MGLFNMQSAQGQPAPSPFDFGPSPTITPTLFNFSPPQQAPQAPQAQPGGRIKPSAWGIIADALSGAAGQPGQYGKMLGEQRQQQMEQAQRAAQAQQQQAAEFAQFQQRRQYEIANPLPAQPTEYERALAESGVQRGSPEWAQHMGQFVGVRENPIQPVDVQNADGSVTRQFVRPNQQQAPRVFHALPPGAVPLGQGGAGSAASPATFR